MENETCMMMIRKALAYQFDLSMDEVDAEYVANYCRTVREQIDLRAFDKEWMAWQKDPDNQDLDINFYSTGIVI